MDTPKYGETLKFVYIRYQPILVKSYQRFTKFKFDRKCIISRERINSSDAACDLVLIQTSLILFSKSSCSYANQFAVNEESRDVCIKARPPPASLAFIGQVTKHTNAKWLIQDQTKYFQT